MPENVVTSPGGETVFDSREELVFLLLATMGCAPQCKVGKPCKYLRKSSSSVCILDVCLAQLCWGLFVTHCLHLIILMNHICASWEKFGS